jgi:hypothetical protein
MTPERLTPKEIRSMVDQSGDIARTLDQANRRDLAELYDALRLAVDYTIARGWLKSRSRLPRVRISSVSEQEHRP